MKTLPLAACAALVLVASGCGLGTGGVEAQGDVVTLSIRPHSLIGQRVRPDADRLTRPKHHVPFLLPELGAGDARRREEEAYVREVGAVAAPIANRQPGRRLRPGTGQPACKAAAANVLDLVFLARLRARRH